jgi:hypothetical protein
MSMRILDKTIHLAVIVTLFSSCYNNNIYYDMKKQLVETCNGKPIRQLYIISQDNHIFYHFALINDQEGVNSFSLLNLNNQYSLEILNRKIPLEGFKLIPGAEYKITNSSYGDAASSDIKIKVGERGEIAFANKTTCQ